MNERDIFISALEKHDSQERSFFLEQACAEDIALRQRVEMLLDLHERAGGFLESPALDGVATLMTTPSLEDPGTLIGPYKLLEQIGEGGMGVVYMAEQLQPVRRRVALKLLKPGMDTRSVIVRFEAERQALALMDHPNIARVFDGGATESGHPYFVMELVRGMPITEYCDQQQASLAARLELFISVCQAVQHAHQKGIIHRDLKPSNVLVTMHDGRAVAKVIDFGIAKAMEQRLTEKTLFTNFMQMVGTPLYMSPEQAEMSALDVDTRTDIYSLGVLLYELLTGTTPFDQEQLREAAFDEVRRIIREDEPARPSNRVSTLRAELLTTVSQRRQTEAKRLSQSLRGELDWIVMKALEKDRTRRYETASAFAADVLRYLQDEPVEAHPPSVLYQLSKLALRRRGVLTATVLVGASLVLGLGLTAWQAIRAGRAEQQAEKRSRQAQQAVDEMYTQVAEKWLAHEPHLQEVQRTFLLRALAFYEDFAQSNVDDPQLTLERGRALRRIGDMQRSLEEPAKANEAYRQALRLLSDLPAESDVHQQYQQELAKSLHGQGLLHVAKGEWSDAEKCLRQAITLQEALVAAFADKPAYRAELASSLNSLGNLFSEVGRTPDARKAYEQSLELLEKVRAEAPSEPDYTGMLVIVYSNLGGILDDLGESEASEKMLQRGLVLLQGLSPDLQNRPTFREREADLQNNLAVNRIKASEFSSASELFKLAVSMRRELASDFPSVLEYQKQLISSFCNWSAALLRMQREPEAQRALDDAESLARSLADRFEDNPEYEALVAQINLSFGSLHNQLGQRQEAAAAYRRSIEQHESLVARDPQVIAHRDALAIAYYNFGLFLKMESQEEAQAAFQRVREVCNQRTADFPLVAENPDPLGAAEHQIAKYLMRKGNHAEARALFEAAIHHRKVVLSKKPRDLTERQGLGDSLAGLAELLVAEGERQAAERLYQEAAEVRQQLVDEQPTNATFQHELGGVLNDLAVQLRKRNEWAEARDLLLLAIEHQGKALSANPGQENYLKFLRNHYINLAHVLDKQGKPEEAIEAFEQAIATGSLLAEAFPNKPNYRFLLGGDHHALSILLKRIGRTREALAHDGDKLLIVEGLVRDFPNASEFAKQLLSTQHETARYRVLFPDEVMKDTWPKALELARQVVEQEPEHTTYWNTLGIAHYRNGNWKEAVTALQKSVELTGGLDAFNGLFLTMAHWRLDQRGEARRFFDQSIAWIAESEAFLQEAELQADILRIRDEATTLTGFTSKVPPAISSELDASPMQPELNRKE